jgi:AcrR family transcriptional regulator
LPHYPEIEGSMKNTSGSKLRNRKIATGRQRIVEAARAHFFNHGFRSVTMDDLAAELGISKKTLYIHFPEKVSLLEAVLANKFASVNAAMARVVWHAPKDFAVALHQLLATTQQELDEIRPPFVRDMRQKAPEFFKTIERRRAEIITKYFGKLFRDGQRAGMVRRDLPVQMLIEILLGAVQAIMNPPKIQELKLTPKSGFTAILKVVLEGALTKKGRTI